MNQIDKEHRRTIPQKIVCWLNTKTNEEIDTEIRQLHHYRQSMYTFDDVDICIDFLTDIDENDAGYLVIAQPIDEQLLHVCDTLNQIRFIYIISHNTFITNTQWIRNYRKVKLINGTMEKFSSQIEKDIRQGDSDFITFQTFNRSINPNEIVSNNLNSSFMYSQLIKEMLVDAELEYDQDYIDTFINVCRAENEDNATQLMNITTFQTTYKNHSAVWWYTKESFLYSTVNQALRTQDVTTLFMMGFFIRDLHLQLIALQQTNPQNQIFDIVYRGQGMTENELQQLRENIGGLLSFNNFLSTTSDYDISLMFARSARDNPNNIGILFRMNINSNINTESPYASLQGISFYPDENEILFSMHTIFRIISVHEIETRLWLIELEFTNDKDQQLIELLAQIRSEIYVPGVFNVGKLGQLSLKMGDYDGALEVYQTLLRLFPDNQILLAYVHHHLGLVYQHKNDLEQSIIHYEKSIDIRRSLASETEVDKYLLIVYANLSGLYAHKAFIQRAEGNFDDALINYQKILDTRLKHLSPYHPDVATAYNNLAAIQGDKKLYRESVESLEHALEISKKSLPDNHEILARLHYNLATAFDDWQKYAEALKHIQNAIDIAQSLKLFDKTQLQYWKISAKLEYFISVN